MESSRVLPGPGLRRGPRPLALHLALAASSNAGSPSWNGSSPSFGPAFASVDPALIRAIAAYRRHPWRRDLPDPPAIWSEGGSQLLDYSAREGGVGPPIVVVPSLVNRAHVLDLMPGRSLLRWLAGEGIRPLLLDWGWPGEAELGFTLTDYVARIERALVALGRPTVLAGYCMGGLLAVATALRQPALVHALVLLATPWDFHAEQLADAVRLGILAPLLDPVMAGGTLPVDAIQTLFALAEPGSVAARYRAFAQLDQASEAAAGFVAVEDWLNDGVPLAAPVAREVFQGWYGANTPARGRWRVAGWPVEPCSNSHTSLRCRPRARPHRAARQCPSPRSRTAGRRCAPSAGRPHRHGRRPALARGAGRAAPGLVTGTRSA